MRAHKRIRNLVGRTKIHGNTSSKEQSRKISAVRPETRRWAQCKILLCGSARDRGIIRACLQVKERLSNFQPGADEIKILMESSAFFWGKGGKGENSVGWEIEIYRKTRTHTSGSLASRRRNIVNTTLWMDSTMENMSITPGSNPHDDACTLRLTSSRICCRNLSRVWLC